MSGRIHSTESFGTVDGPGVRFVVFFQGCPMRCRYCHNPDTWDITGGREVTAEELMREYDSYKEFLRSGGITATGGEPMMQPEFLKELFSLAHSKGVHTCLDTSGVTYDPECPERADEILQYTDLVMLDIKHIDPVQHRKLTGHDNANILAFAEHISDRSIPLWIRHVVVPGITDDREYLFRLGEFLSRLHSLKALDVLPYHDMAKAKYRELGIEYTLPDTPPLTKEQAKDARDIIMKGLMSGLKRKKSQEGE
ncbi:MAG: pyruvate formate lyase-activating protein [Ruminococcus sp.]|nr:pyruvate formate lyase-activating protein [Ruminococcus sp.]